MERTCSPKRWEIAQDSEREYWDEYNSERLIKEEVIRHKEKARIIEQTLSKIIQITKGTKILQIGCGPEDVINYFSTGRCYAIDPLADFYKQKFKLDYKKVTFLQARAENLPFKEDYFDVVILSNVLDHVESPVKALSEINRVLKREGIFYFENLFYQPSFIFLSKLWAPIKRAIAGEIFNIHHPYMFKLTNLKELLKSNFLIIQQESGKEIGLYENIQELKKMKQKDPRFTSKILSSFGIYGTINYTAICRKRQQ